MARNKPKSEPEPEKPEVKAPPPAPPVVPAGWTGWKWAVPTLLGLIALDQITKLLSVHYLAPVPKGLGKVAVLIPKFFYLRYAENTGAAFSILREHTSILAMVSLAATVLLVLWWRKLPVEEKWGRIALVGIAAGAIGNLIDRVRLRYVIDMIDLWFGKYNYPTFNVADSLICVGVGVLLLRSFKGKV